MKVHTNKQFVSVSDILHAYLEKKANEYSGLLLFTVSKGQVLELIINLADDTTIEWASKIFLPTQVSNTFYKIGTYRIPIPDKQYIRIRKIAKRTGRPISEILANLVLLYHYSNSETPSNYSQKQHSNKQGEKAYTDDKDS